MGWVRRWKLELDDVDEIITDNPSLRGMVFGYAAEVKCRKMWFSGSEVSDVRKHDDHDRTHKGDIAFTYRGYDFNIEVKSLQTNSIRRSPAGLLTADYQCDASDRRPVHLSDGTVFNTTCLKVGEFDLVAVNCWAFFDDWKFVFARNDSLRRLHPSARNGLSARQANELIATSHKISYTTSTSANSAHWPAIYADEPWALLDQLVEDKNRGVAPNQVYGPPA